MFRTYSYSDQKVNESPVYYINNNNEEITCKQLWECSYKTKYFIPGYSDHTLIESEFQNAKVSEFIVREKKILNPKKPIITHLMKINSDFDENLLKDIFDLLEKRNQ